MIGYPFLEIPARMKNSPRRPFGVATPSSWSIKTKLLLTVVLLAIAPLVALGSITSLRTREALVHDADTALLSTTRATASAIDRLNVERMRTVSLVAASPAIQKALLDPKLESNRAAVLDVMHEYRASNKGYTAVFLMD